MTAIELQIQVQTAAVQSLRAQIDSITLAVQRPGSGAGIDAVRCSIPLSRLRVNWLTP